MAPTTRSRAAAGSPFKSSLKSPLKSSLKHKAAPRPASKIKPKAIKTEIMKTASLLEASKSSPSSKSESNRVTERSRRSTGASTSRRKHTTKKEEGLAKKSIKVDDIKEEEPQGEKVKKGTPNRKGASGEDGKDKSWEDMWIGPGHPLYELGLLGE
jgi:hypothetical protein